MSTKKSAWQETELKNFINIVRGVSYNKQDLGTESSENFIPLLRSNNIQNDKIVYDDFVFVNKSKIKEEQYVKKNDILIAMSSGSKNLVGKTAFIDENNIISFGAFCGLIRLKNNYIYSKFLSLFFQTKEYRINISKLSKGSNINNLKLDYLYNMKIKYPPLEEQKLIVEKIESEFQKIDEALTKLNIIKEQIKQYKQSVLKYAFDENNSFAKGSNYEPYEWEEKILNDIIDKSKNAIKRGPFGSSLKKEFFVENGIRVFEQYNPINNDPYWCRYRITKEKYEELKEFKCKEGDFLISCSGVSLGRIVELPNGVEEGIINQALLKITIDKNIINNKYFILLFRSPEFQNKILGNARGAAIQNIASVKELKNIKIKLPNIELQKNIADNIQNIFEKMENIQNNINQNIDKLNVLKQAVLKKAFEGKLI